MCPFKMNQASTAVTGKENTNTVSAISCIWPQHRFRQGCLYSPCGTKRENSSRSFLCITCQAASGKRVHLQACCKRQAITKYNFKNPIVFGPIVSSCINSNHDN